MVRRGRGGTQRAEGKHEGTRQGSWSARQKAARRKEVRETPDRANPAKVTLSAESKRRLGTDFILDQRDQPGRSDKHTSRPNGHWPPRLEKKAQKHTQRAQHSRRIPRRYASSSTVTSDILLVAPLTAQLDWPAMERRARSRRHEQLERNSERKATTEAQRKGKGKPDKTRETLRTMPKEAPGQSQRGRPSSNAATKGRVKLERTTLRPTITTHPPQKVHMKNGPAKRRKRRYVPKEARAHHIQKKANKHSGQERMGSKKKQEDQENQES